tara:strand:+ start:488 stop:718 length:231 start_codon:yes stop_codon:yes gene_type:complete
MNYIHKLQETVKMKDTSLDYIDEKVVDLMMHLQSSKFHIDPTIQVADVLRWLEPIRSELCMHYCDRRAIARPLEKE